MKYQNIGHILLTGFYESKLKIILSLSNIYYQSKTFKINVRVFFLLCVYNHFTFVAVETRTFAYVVLSANCDKIICGLFKSMLAIPISPLASPLPSTTATMTDGACADTAEDAAGNSWQIKHTQDREWLFVLLHVRPQSPECSYLCLLFIL